jgi:hypothetical protein
MFFQPLAKKAAEERERKKREVCHGLFLVTPESDFGAIWCDSKRVREYLGNWVGSPHKATLAG